MDNNDGNHESANGSTGPAAAQRRRLAAELYEQVMHAHDDEVGALFARRVPRARALTDRWTRNNLAIGSPKPELVLESLGNVDELAEHVERAAAQRSVVKAIGDGWGFSSAGESRHYLVPMRDSFDHVDGIRDDGRCTFRGGARIQTLNDALREEGWALSNAPGYDQLTFAGTMAMGGHGSGVALGPLSAQALEIELLHVDAKGKARTCTFTAADDFFPAVAVSLGALGIITSMTIAVEKAYQLAETRTLRRWDDVKGDLPELMQRQREGRLHSVEIWINPYLVDGEVWCVVGTRAKTKKPPSGERPWALTSGTPTKFAALGALMSAFPGLIPDLLHAALSGSQEDKVILPSAEGLGFGATNRARVCASELSVDLAQTASTVDALIAGLQRRADGGRWVTSPIGLRFVARAHAWMAMAFGRDTCTIELPLLEGTPHAKETLEWFVRSFSKGRPHWGQWNPLRGAELRERYPSPAVALFHDAMEALDPCRVFANDFVHDLRSSWGSASSRPKPAFAAVPRGLAPAARANWHEEDVQSYSRLFCDPTSARVRVTHVGDGDILERFREAASENHHYTVRGGGYAMHSQAIRQDDGDRYLTFRSEGGRPKIHVDRGPKLLTVSADATWHAIVHATLAQGLLPRVIVTAPNATVGGTLASNSIGQACRRFGHEADGVRSIKVAIPNWTDGKPRVVTLGRPKGPTDTSDEAQLFRAVIRGYGLIGLILEATYDLTAAPADTSLPSVVDCEGRCDPGRSGPKCAAVTDVMPFREAELGNALARLKPSGPGDDDYRACVLFWTGDEWCARVTSTRLEAREHFGDHLVTYEGDTPKRKLAEVLLSTMSTASLAGRIAACATERPVEGYVDPVCGYLFTMLPNQSYKELLPRDIARAVASSVQMTFVIPEEKAVAFLEHCFRALTFEAPKGVAHTSGLKDDHVVQAIAEEHKALFAWLAGLERDAQAHLRRSAPAPLSAGQVRGADDEAVVGSWLRRVVSAGRLVPALFEMVWVPADDHFLSATHGMSGYAISLTFQGPGTNPNGPLEQYPPYRGVCRQLYRAYEQLSKKADELGGRVHLTKNVFMGGDQKQTIAKMFGDRLTSFRALREKYDPQYVLRSAFASDVLGLK
jgi:L-gulono-1,4-lactone dehydrogenase